MSYTPGEEIFQETAKGKTKIIKTQPDYEEGTAYIRNDREYAGDVVDEMSGIADDIYEEVGDLYQKLLEKVKPMVAEWVMLVAEWANVHS
jgi:hypothetical protein